MKLKICNLREVFFDEIELERNFGPGLKLLWSP